MLLILGCSEYSLVGPPGAASGEEGTSGTTPDLEAASVDACPDAAELPQSAAIDESCDTEPVLGEIPVRVEWERSDFWDYPEYNQVLAAPVVGQLDDDDGNGVIDREDVPDVVVVADDDGADNGDFWGQLAILRGSDGAVSRTIMGAADGEDLLYAYRYTSPALADLDRDGVPEIVTVVRVVVPAGEGSGGEGTDPEDSPVGPPPPDFEPQSSNDACALAAFHADGSLVWRAEEYVQCAGHMLSVADLDGDGRGEVLVGQDVYDADGNWRWSSAAQARYPAYDEVGTQPVAMDLDGDGEPEVLFGAAVHQGDGALRCQIPAEDADGFPAAADLDGDGRGEIVLVGAGGARVYEDDCSPVAAWSLVGSGNGGPPTIADFDGDTQPEIGVAEAESYTVYEADGRVLWSAPVTDASSHATGSSVFDFDGDGRAEVVYGDETTLWIFDGATGAVRLADDRRESRTLHELPVVADVDADGEMEIVVPRGGGHWGQTASGLYVLGSDGEPWRGDRQVWNQHAYSITNIEDDLTLPWPARANWPFYNNFRSGSLSPSAGGALPDAIGYLQTCDDACDDGVVGVEARLANGGMAALRAGLPITLYAEVEGEVVALATTRSEAVIEPGAAGPTWQLELDVDEIPDGVLVLRVDDELGVDQALECHEGDEVRLEGVGCP